MASGVGWRAMAALSGATLCTCERLSRDGSAWLPRRGVHALHMVFLFRLSPKVAKNPFDLSNDNHCRLSNNFSRLTYKFSRVFEPLKAKNRPVPTHIFSVEQAAPFSHNQGCANSLFHNETKIYESGHNTIRKAHLHDDMKNYGSETETMCPFSGKPLDPTTVIMLHRKIMWQDHKSHMVLTD